MCHVHYIQYVGCVQYQKMSAAFCSSEQLNLSNQAQAIMELVQKMFDI